MNDLEMTKLCAEAMGIKFCPECLKNDPSSLQTTHSEGRPDQQYDPLHDDAQAMALVKKFQMLVRWDGGVHGWTAGIWYSGSKGQALWNDWTAQDLNRAICECVAKMQAARGA